MPLSDFHARISRSLRRGTAQDDIIPDVVSEAALFLEQNYSFDYMNRVVSVTINPLAASPERIDFPSLFVKSWRFVRIANAATAYAAAPYSYLKKVEPEDVSALSYGRPAGYYLDAATQLVLDAIPQEALVVELAYREYTDWPTDTAATPVLLRLAPNLLRAQTLVQMAEELRDPRMVQVYTAMREEALSAVLRAQEESKMSGTDNVMVYVPR